MIIVMGKSIHTLLCPFLAPVNLRIYCQMNTYFHLLMQYVMMTGCLRLCETAVPNVNVLRHFINPNGGVMLDNSEMLDDGNAGPLVGPYDSHCHSGGFTHIILWMNTSPHTC